MNKNTKNTVAVERNGEFEPKNNMRHAVYITNDKNETIIPTCFIKGTSRPSFEVLNKNKLQFSFLEVECYDPIEPSLPQVINNTLAKKDKWNIVINVLGPVGNKVEEWTIKNAKLKNVIYSPLNWESKSDDLATITMYFDISNTKLNY